VEVAANCIHGTTRQRPLTLFIETEKPFLRPLPDVVPQLATWTQVKVHGNCHVQFEKAYYSVPFHLVHQHLWLKATDNTVKPLKASQDEDFHDVISERYERKSTIVTSNLDIPEWTDAFPNKLLGSATIDRLRHGAYTVVLEGNSFRAPKPIPKIHASTAFKTPKSVLVKGGEIR
jgi:hypothetical protein